MMNKIEIICSDVFNALPVGKSNAIKSREVTYITGYDGRTIRFAVNELRKQGYPVCSTTYDGYWVTDNIGDLQRTAGVLASQIDTLQETLVGLYRAMEAINDGE